MKCQILFSGKNKKNIINLSSTEKGKGKQQLSSALLSACDFKSHFCKQCGPRSDCSSRSSLIRVHSVCLYSKMQEYSAGDINRGHFQMQVFLAF